MSLLSISVREFCDALASGDPTPGGGCASALAGAHAAALLSMYCRLTLGRKKYASAVAVMTESLDELERARARLLELVDLDADAYGAVIAAMALPKKTKEEQARRREAIEAATMRAAKVPLEVCAWAVRLLQTARKIYAQGNPNALSDAGVGAQLALASFSGAALNVYINLGSLSDEASVVASKKTVHDLESQIRALSVEIAAGIYGRLGVNG
jgi:methenyltetrahydrofolate cyclohydrolase